MERGGALAVGGVWEGVGGVWKWAGLWRAEGWDDEKGAWPGWWAGLRGEGRG